MIGTVLVPLDGSSLAEQALPYAKAIAERSHAPVHLVRVIPAEAPVTEQAEAREYLQKMLDQFVNRVQMSVRVGSPEEQIIAASDEVGDATIVMTTHGRSGLSRWFSGSVADRVVRGSGCPVLLIRSNMERAEPAVIRSILVPLDGSDYAEVALRYAEEVARTFDAELRLTRVAEIGRLYRMVGPSSLGPTAVGTLTELADRMVQDTQQYLAETADRVRANGLRVHTQALEGFPSDQLLAYERETDVDLVVMATHAREGLSRLVFGSVAEQMLRLGAVPVMVIRPQGEEAEEPGPHAEEAAAPVRRDADQQPQTPAT